MSANYKYFQPLKHSLMLIKKNFPELEIIVYNMGFSKQMIKEVTKKPTYFSNRLKKEWAAYVLD